MSIDYIIVQAGGKGTRLKELTINKPKAIVSVENLPIIFHLFKKYPHSKYVIIGDYKKNVLDKYLEAFANVEFITVGTDDEKGTCSGISNALKMIPPNKGFLIIWSDLILNDNVSLPDDGNNYVGISGDFECRWSFVDDNFIEKSSSKNGVAGLFLFTDKSIIQDVPKSGEFVKWLQTTSVQFKRLELSIEGGCSEFGLIERIKGPSSGKCRPFNRTTICDGKLIKEGINEQGYRLAEREKAWYKYVSAMNIQVPKIFSFEPLTMEYINGKNVFDYRLTKKEKYEVLQQIIDGLNNMHEHDTTYPNRFDIKEAYYNKTLDRLKKVRELIPLTNHEYIVINDRVCRNVFYHLDELREKIQNITCEKFCLIHGDCTFSNIILKKYSIPFFIDPRGYFGSSELVGDPNYDWSKLYYSIVGNYDQFNLGRFSLRFLNDDKVSLNIQTNDWEEMESVFFSMLPTESKIEDIKLIHAIIWLSLTTYAWNDYDSICGAFYNGLYYLEEVL